MQAPPNLPTRPTTDFAKEALFNILQHRFDFESLRVLDLFAGIGSISLEFASRGSQVTAVEKHLGCIRHLQQIKRDWKIDAFEIRRQDVFRFIDQMDQPADLVFADPPYALDKLAELPDLILKPHILKPSGTLILEHGTNHTFEEHPKFMEHRKYSAVNFSFFEYD